MTISEQLLKRWSFSVWTCEKDVYRCPERAFSPLILGQQPAQSVFGGELHNILKSDGPAIGGPHLLRSVWAVSLGVHAKPKLHALKARPNLTPNLTRELGFSV